MRFNCTGTSGFLLSFSCDHVENREVRVTALDRVGQRTTARWSARVDHGTTRTATVPPTGLCRDIRRRLTLGNCLHLRPATFGGRRSQSVLHLRPDNGRRVLPRNGLRTSIRDRRRFCLPLLCQNLTNATDTGATAILGLRIDTYTVLPTAVTRLYCVNFFTRGASGVILWHSMFRLPCRRYIMLQPCNIVNVHMVANFCAWNYMGVSVCGLRITFM